ncbi:hypothetical protein DL96DRAFT_1625078 [Flagelloscypha sp. PMI_526]|nr:hypothetical protein DL96DRAFT_1625078 [Flagelloscypha sp. PMI_526]
MPTPKAGTVQHRELEPIYLPHPTERSVKDWLFPLAWFIGIITVIVGYDICNAALKSFFLDLFLVWGWRTPSESSHIDRYAWFYAALLARCLTTPVTLKLFIMFLGP